MSEKQPSAQERTYDVVVVGGGAAGLSGALALGRSRRSVLVLDAGNPRNAPAAHVHNYLGREGTPPLDLLEMGRGEVAQYGVEVARAEVVAVRPWDEQGIGFVVSTDDGREIRGCRLLVATGVTDVLPEVPGLAERWGRDVLHCPYCHGWEVRDQTIAVLATSATATHQALLFRQLSNDVVMVLADPAVTPGAEDLQRLHARGVRIVADAPVEVLVEDDVLRGLRLACGDELACDAVVVSAGFRPRADFLAPLGLLPEPFVMGDAVVGATLRSDPMGATSVPGVWLAGNVGDPMAQVVASAAAGLRVGALVNYDLVQEEATAAVAAHRAERDGFFEEGAWEERYAASDAIWSGRVNPQLEREVAGLTPGRALDVGSGEGADVIWLARQGWTVTGLDFSTVALERAAAHAAAAGVAERTDWRHRDVRTFGADAIAGEQWDLVTSQFMHLPDGGMVDLTRRLAGVVAPDGTLLVVGHHPDDLGTGLRHGHADFMFTPDALVPALDPQEWEVDVAEVRSREVTGPDGGQVTVRDSVLRAHRRP